MTVRMGLTNQTQTQTPAHTQQAAAAADKGKGKAKAAEGVARKPLDADSECGVCFEALVEGAEGMSACKQCGNSIHTTWWVSHHSCPIPLLPSHVEPPTLELTQTPTETPTVQLRQVEGPERDPLRPGPELRLLPRHQLRRARLSARRECMMWHG